MALYTRILPALSSENYSFARILPALISEKLASVFIHCHSSLRSADFRGAALLLLESLHYLGACIMYNVYVVIVSY